MPDPVPIIHVVAGRAVEGGDVPYGRGDHGGAFSTPKLVLDELVVPRHTPGPAFEVPVSDVIDFLAATGDALTLDANRALSDSLEAMVRLNPLGHRILEACYRQLGAFFCREALEFQVENDIGGADVLDGWRTVCPPGDRPCAVRAFPPRLVHILAGNGPGVAAITITRAALTKGVHLLKLPSNDLFTATAILRTMAAVDASHPVVRSFSAVYWQGGDQEVEPFIYRPQYFDKLVAWGGDAAIRGVLGYLGPGLELVAFDPKVSLSLIGREAFADEATMRHVADLAAADATMLDQEACAASRYMFVEGDGDDIDRFCAALTERLGVDRPMASAISRPTPGDLRAEVDVLRLLTPAFRVWGSYEGGGLVIRSEAPVDFHPTGKTVNVVPTASLDDAVHFATVATQTVGVYPPQRKRQLRDALANAGVQRVVPLGSASEWSPGIPHDAMYPLHRLMRWITDEDAA